MAAASLARRCLGLGWLSAANVIRHPSTPRRVAIPRFPAVTLPTQRPILLVTAKTAAFSFKPVRVSL